MLEKARITTVKLGTLEFEGLMLPDGSFGITVSQLSRVFPESVSQNNYSRQVKSALGKDFPLVKTSSELNSKQVNYITIENLEKLIVELSIKGDSHAQELNRTLVGLSLTQLFSDAFGVKFESEERQNFLKFRAVHKKQFHPLFTSWLKLDGIESGVQYAIKVNQLKMKLELPLISCDKYTEEQIDKLNNGERAYHTLRNVGFSHQKALQCI
jgi:hypothetical protein